MVLGDDQYYYISHCEDQGSICLIMTPDENGIVSDAGLEARRDLINHVNTTLISIVKSISKVSGEFQLPVAYVPCPQCDKLHITLEIVCAAKKRALRCKTKLPLGYYCDLARKGM